MKLKYLYIGLTALIIDLFIVAIFAFTINVNNLTDFQTGLIMLCETLFVGLVIKSIYYKKINWFNSFTLVFWIAVLEKTVSNYFSDGTLSFAIIGLLLMTMIYVLFMNKE